MKRKTGILLHISSLPGRYWIGDFGAVAYGFVDWLKQAGFSLWQVLPLLPPDENGSPYSSHSAYGISRLFINPEELIKDGLLFRSTKLLKLRNHKTDYSLAFFQKSLFVDASYQYFNRKKPARLTEEFKQFCARNAWWLDDHALFDAIKAKKNGQAWFTWPKDIKTRKEGSFEKTRQELAEDIEKEKYSQWLAHRQWKRLKSYANKKGVEIIGDVPFYVRHDSVDVWANQNEYLLDKKGQPTLVGGVPPDMFSKLGQRWGNPVYCWPAMKKNNFRWWIKRVKYYASLFDALRLDHFRAFESLWAIPARAKDARKGKWTKSPGKTLLKKIKKAAGRPEIFAEDLGYITRAVDRLRQSLKIPGIRVIIFGLGHQMDSPSLPHNFPADCISYSGTHDTETALGFFNSAPKERKRKILAYLGGGPKDFRIRLLELGFASKSKWFILPMQDILGLGNKARMNTPNQKSGNWTWRLSDKLLTKKLAKKYLAMIKKTKRI